MLLWDYVLLVKSWFSLSKCYQCLYVTFIIACMLLDLEIAFVFPAANRKLQIYCIYIENVCRDQILLLSQSNDCT